MLAASLKKQFGIAVRPIAQNEIEQYGIGSQQGVVVTEVDSNGPFGKAGFEKGDIILQVDNQSVSGPDTLYTVLNAVGPHKKVTVAAVDQRTGQAGNIEVTLP